ncbi:very long chain fatty acid elongase 1-like isoform X2 [Halictus rubicundus]|uniref:very long chain fatty acid elongase 1-like isoform X2 n=1 Tax=Halictus rubicundus TaxID=77578 RepID=UPI004036E8CE
MGILELYNHYWNEDLDPRSKDLPFVASNYQIPLLLIAYLYIVLKWGPNYMKNRNPYSLKTFIRYYNVFQVIINAFIIIRLIQLGLFDEPTRFCYPTDYSFNPTSLQIVYTLWLCWMIKIVDLIETITFVLRKKSNQVSFLHLYHHITVLLLGWYITRFHIGKMAAIPAIVNCSVHVVMYSYYYFSTFGDKAPKILQQVKPLITIMQMVQFVILVLHSFVAYLPSCHTNLTTAANVQIANLIINFVLFYNFYQKSYKAQQKQKK